MPDETPTPSTTGSPKTTLLGLAVLLGALLVGAGDHFDVVQLKTLGAILAALGTTGGLVAAKDH